MKLPDRTGWMTGALAAAPSCPPFPQFTAFEQAVLEEVAAAFDADENAFRSQVSASRVIDRINSGVGFFTRVETDSSRSPKLSLDGPVTFHVQVDGFEHGLLFMVWLSGGYVDDLEGVLTLSDTDTLSGVDLASLRFVRVLNDGRKIEPTARP